MNDLLAIFGGQEDRHEAAFQLGAFFHVGDLSTAGGEIQEQLLTNIGMRHFTAAEADADLDPVAVCQELLGSLDLGVQVIGVDAGAHTDLLDLHDPLVLFGILLPLLLVVAEFGIVHDLADRGNGVGRDLQDRKSTRLNSSHS